MSVSEWNTRALVEDKLKIFFWEFGFLGVLIEF